MSININMVNVGDGDAIILTLKRKIKTRKAVILIDGGEKGNAKKVLKCLKKTLLMEKKDAPDLTVCTHYDQDHIGGIIKIVEKYKCSIKQIWIHRPTRAYKNIMEFLEKARNPSCLYERLVASNLIKKFNDNINLRNEVELVIESFNQLKTLDELIKKYKIKTKEPFGFPENNYLDGFSEFKVIGPTVDFYNRITNVTNGNKIERLLEEKSLFENSSSSNFRELFTEVLYKKLPIPICDRLPNESNQSITSTNEVSIIVLYTDEDGRKFLFPGDAGIESFISIPNHRNILRDLYYMTVPHHGSLNNISKELIEIMRPRIAFISAKGNRHHPHKYVVGCLKSHGTKIYETKGCDVIKFKNGKIKMENWPASF
jgi:beta-lactamase superfamily II metal-dependent hydrolase